MFRLQLLSCEVSKLHSILSSDLWLQLLTKEKAKNTQLKWNQCFEEDHKKVNFIMAATFAQI